MTRNEIEEARETALNEAEHIISSLRYISLRRSTIYDAASELKDMSDRLFEIDEELANLDDEEPEDEEDSSPEDDE